MKPALINHCSGVVTRTSTCWPRDGVQSKSPFSRFCFHC